MFDEIIDLKVGAMKLELLDRAEKAAKKVAAHEADETNDAPTESEKQLAATWEMMQLASLAGVAMRMR